MLFLVVLALFILPFKISSSFNVTINTNPVRTVPEKFLSVSLDSLSAYPDTWNYLDFNFMAPLAKALAPAYFRFGGTYSDLMVFNETNNGPMLQIIPGCLPNTIYGNYCTIFTGQNCPDGWYKEKTVSNKCLKIVDAITQPWFSANLECTTYGFQSSLLSIDGAFENAEITRKNGYNTN
uniref:Uncharacterized protein n=1 Tax=Acrobeloides nanus TaxID=290746 RepID=A0A914EIM6_9BILA